MVNVVCVKYGTKYNSSHVNRLYRMVEKNLSLPFSFYCMTDDSENINKQIKIIPLNLDLELESFWYKVTMFDNSIYGNNDLTLYLDLDTIIQNPIDDLFNDPSLPLRIVYTGSIKVEDESTLFGKWQGNVNSSIMLFRPSRVQHISEHFLEDPDFYILEYQGVCRYLWNVFEKDLEYFKIIEDFYPVLNKSQEFIDIEDHERWLVDIGLKYKNGRLGSYFVPHSKIAMLNGCSQHGVLNKVLEFFSSYYE